MLFYGLCENVLQPRVVRRLDKIIVCAGGHGIYRRLYSTISGEKHDWYVGMMLGYVLKKLEAVLGGHFQVRDNGIDVLITDDADSAVDIHRFEDMIPLFLQNDREHSNGVGFVIYDEYLSIVNHSRSLMSCA